MLRGTKASADVVEPATASADSDTRKLKDITMSTQVVRDDQGTATADSAAVTGAAQKELLDAVSEAEARVSLSLLDMVVASQSDIPTHRFTNLRRRRSYAMKE